MKATTAIAIAASHGCSIGRYKPGLYYVTWADATGAHTQYVAGRHLRDAVSWIKSNRAA